MKRNNELILEILRTLEQSGVPMVLTVEQFAGEFGRLTQDYLKAHIDLLLEHDLIDCQPSPDRPGLTLSGIMWSGHDFVGCAKHPVVWKAAVESAGDLPFDDFVETLTKGAAKAAMQKMTTLINSSEFPP